MKLTKREQEIAALVSQGLRSKEIAEKLYLSHRTVESHVCTALQKLALNSRTALAAYWQQRERESRQKEAEEIKALALRHTRLLSVIIDNPGISTRQVAHCLKLSFRDAKLELLKLAERQVVFNYHTKPELNLIQWFPTVVGLALYKADRDLKAKLVGSGLAKVDDSV